MKTLFITGHRKSGTTLLTSLFDGHDDLAVYPTDLSLMYAYFPYFNNNNYSFKVKKERIKKILEKSLSVNLNYRVKKKNLKINDFIRNILSRLNYNNINNIKKILNILKNEFTKFYNLENKKYFLIKETSSDIYFNNMFKKKDNIKFIHLIRDPRDNYASLKSGIKTHYSKIGESNLILLSSMINRAKLDFEFININKKMYGNKNYLVIKYEELIKNTDKTMKKISNFLNIKYSKKMLFSSIFNIKTKSNTFTKKRTTEINNKSIKRWKNELSQKEKSILNFFFKSELKKFYKINNEKDIKYKHISDFYSLLNKKFFFNDSFK